MSFHASRIEGVRVLQSWVQRSGRGRGVEELGWMSLIGSTDSLAAALGSVKGPNPVGISVICAAPNQRLQVANDRDAQQASNASRETFLIRSFHGR